MTNKETNHEEVKHTGSLVVHGAALVLGLLLVVVGMAMGVTLVLLPVGILAGISGLLLIVWALYMKSKA
jgi:uncharacterized membrane protein HdeD (DUF308 family)